MHNRIETISLNLDQLRYIVSMAFLLLLLAFTTSISYAESEPVAPSAESIKAEQEKKYAALIIKIKVKNPVNDAKEISDIGFPYLLGHYEGRGETLIIPAVDMAIYNKNKARCPVLMMEGLGDSIYGKNHLEYRRLMDVYANKFNTFTFKRCLQNK